MKLTCCLAILGVVLVIHGYAAAVDDKVRLLSATRRSGVRYDWILPSSRASAAPVWRPDQGQEPPLALMKAIAIARNDGEKGEKLESVAILSIPGATYAPPFDTVFYYKCTFIADPFDRRICIVLMDGTVLRPIPAKHPPGE